MSEAYTIGYSAGHLCNCIGPQNGQPLCPCQMRSVSIRDGRYVREQDFGPVKCIPTTETREEEIARLRKRLSELEGK